MNELMDGSCCRDVSPRVRGGVRNGVGPCGSGAGWMEQDYGILTQTAKPLQI